MANRRFYYKSKSKRPAPDAAQASAEYTAEQLSLTLADLGIGEPLSSLLQKNGINVARDLVVRSEKDMYRVQGFNKKALFEVISALKKQGMALRTDASAAKPKAPEPERKPQPKEQKPQKDAPKSGRFGLADRGDDGARPVSRPQKPNEPQREQRPVVREPLPVELWRKIIRGGKWGFSDGLKTVIQPQYDEVFLFKEGLASVELDGKCGYIDPQNNVVIPFEYDTAMSFSEGLAMVVKGEKCGYIDKNNAVIFDFEYDAATAFEEGEAKVKKDGKWATLTRDGSLTFI